MRARGSIAIVALAFSLAMACADASTESNLVVTPATEDSPEIIQADWKYGSGEVDVQVSLRTTRGEPCVSIGRVRVNEALEDVTHYYTPDTACDVLRIEANGDVVMNDGVTGHDWSREPLAVDTDRERIHLGPWRDEAHDIVYELVLSAPPCEDDHDCDCPRLERLENDTRTLLEFERRCD
jgi:hypothetical protein